MTDVVADRPTVVLVEDIHWAEPQLLDLLELAYGLLRVDERLRAYAVASLTTLTSY